jgi:large subunit ribosomal protein L13
MKTYSPKAKDIEREWWVIDATDKTLGKIATQVANLLMGKHKPIYAPHIDTGDYVVVINAAKVKVTGKKAEQKIYYRHSGYPGGL